MPLPKRRSSRELWVAMFVASLVFHGATVLGLRIFQAISPPPVEAQSPAPIDVVLVDSDALAAPTQGPTAFSELPPDRADLRPEHPDFLSNVDSRARDMVPGGEESMPRMTGESESPAVAMTPDGSTADPSKDTKDAEDTDKADGSETDPEDVSPDGVDLQAARRAREEAGLLNPGVAGGSDFLQPEMSYPGGNADLMGDISLNTLAWDYAPWLQRFRRELMRRWYAPTAYYMGILKEGGWAMMEMEVAPSGEMLRLDLLEEEGHTSLTEASLAALRSTAPLEALPAHFPEPTLVLRIRMIYPKVRSR